MTMDWHKVAEGLEYFVRHSPDDLLDHGQRATVTELARRISSGQRAALLADEVGMGKTRIAVALVEAVRRAGGRTAIVLPAGLGAQWQQELRRLNPDDRTLLPLRSYDGFIAGFLQDDDAEGSDRRKRSHKEWLLDRRQQRELPEHGWAAEKIVMISHSFAAMRFPARAEGPAGGWRRELLPNVARLVEGRRRNLLRDNFHTGEIGYVHASRRAAQTIAVTIIAQGLDHDLKGDQKWLGADDYKNKILPLIGYGLGQFDLVVVDEAHKSRGVDSSLSRILGPVSWEADDSFRLGMTATPVELDKSQWIDTLERISGREDGQDIAALADLAQWIGGYVDIVQRVRSEELDEALTSGFEMAAKQFRTALQPFVLRRDKRHDPEYRSFQERYGDYRQIEDIAVSPETEGFTKDWLRRFCAAEALSMLAQDDPRIKRARLSVAQSYGFGLSAEDTETVPDAPDRPEGPASVWLDEFSCEAADIFSHPALLATVRLIESYAANKEKVLVFGKFLTPMLALTRLLDAREMLRRLRDGEHWPATKLREENIPAVIAAMQDPDLAAPTGGIIEINTLLSDRYRDWSASRKTELAKLRREIEALAKEDGTAKLLADLLFQNEDGEDLHAEIGAILEALGDRRQTAGPEWSGAEMLDLFRSLLKDILVGDEENEIPDDLQERLAVYLQDYSGREGNFARLMSGNTAPQTRRLLQAAFNRASSWPMVLLAQSRVGREGLNLHEACRTVVLLHAEWNPGVVEQQIGRVDRKNSLWLRELRDWTAAGATGNPPRIRIHSIVVTGTYDDHNWQVLKERWADLRGQLHGKILPDSAGCSNFTDGQADLQNRLRAATPDFGPPYHES
jgi:superfamily II DNA or RNA helicase